MKEKHNVKADRPQPLLSLEMDMFSLRLLLAVNAHNLSGASLNNTPACQKLHEIVWEPKVGDWVYESSTIYEVRGSTAWAMDHSITLDVPDKLVKSIGIMVRIDHIPSYRSQRAWDAARAASIKSWATNHPEYPPLVLGAEIPTTRVYYVQYGPTIHDVCRWENATFHVIPREIISI